MNWYEALFEPSGVILRKIGVFFLILLTVLVFLLLGWFLALIFKNLLLFLFKKINLNKRLTGSWIGRFLSRGGMTKAPSELLSNFCYWAVLVIFIVLASQSLGIGTTDALLDRFLIFLPRVLAFGLILIFGIIFAGFVGRVLQIIAGNLGIKEFKVIGRILQVVVIIYAAILALEQLGIAVFAVAASFNIFWAALCLTLALAVGLGGKDLVKGLLGNFAGKLKGQQQSPGENSSKQGRKRTRKAQNKQEMLPYD